MTQINAYLGFSGNCREAMTFYKDCLGGELTLLPVEGSPAADQMPADTQQNILHSCLIKGDLTLMATDMGQGERSKGSQVSLMLNCSSEEEVNQFFAALSSGGNVTCPLGQQFWGAIFGSLTDKFGMNWMLSYDKTTNE